MRNQRFECHDSITEHKVDNSHYGELPVDTKLVELLECELHWDVC